MATFLPPHDGRRKPYNVPCAGVYVHRNMDFRRHFQKNDSDCETKHVYTGWSDVPARWDPYLGIYRSSKFDYGPVPVQKKPIPLFQRFCYLRERLPA